MTQWFSTVSNSWTGERAVDLPSIEYNQSYIVQRKQYSTNLIFTSTAIYLYLKAIIYAFISRYKLSDIMITRAEHSQ